MSQRSKALSCSLSVLKRSLRRRKHFPGDISANQLLSNAETSPYLQRDNCTWAESSKSIMDILMSKHFPVCFTSPTGSIQRDSELAQIDTGNIICAEKSNGL